MTQCFLCASEVGADGASVCGVCVKKQLGPTVRATAEFIVPSVNLDEPSSSAPAPAPAPASLGRCSWCDREAASVKKLLSNGSLLICNQCVAFCAEVMEAEIGPQWRE